MGNAIDAEGARAYGYVGEFDLKWIREKVSATVEAICSATAVAVGKGIPTLLGAIRKVGGMLQQAPMNHDLLDDPELLARLDTANRGIIAKAFDNVTLGQVKELLEGLKTPQRPPSLKGSEAPVEGDVPNTEGMVLLQDWSSRD